MWYAPLYQDTANQSAIVQVMPATVAPVGVLPAGWHWGRTAVTGEALSPQAPHVPARPRVPAKPPTSCGLVIPVNSALGRTISLPAAYRYSASQAVRYVANQIGWRFIQQRSVPMALVQIGMPWAPKTATAFTLLKRMADKDPGLTITVNFVQKTITYQAAI